MTLEAFQEEANELIERLRYLVEQSLLKQGDKIADCRQTALLAAIERTARIITGVEVTDLKPGIVIKVGVAGYNRGSLFDVFCGTLIVSEEQRDNNVHLDVAEALAELAGIPDVRVRFDDADDMGAPLLAVFKNTGRVVDISNLSDEKLEIWLREKAAEVAQTMQHDIDAVSPDVPSP